jgi:hypothetical protein
MVNGYEQTYQAIVPLLKACDFADAAKRLGFSLVSEQLMTIDFLGRTYQITKAGVQLLADSANDTVHVNFLSVLVYYAVSKGSTEPLYDFCLMHNFAQGLFSSDNTSTLNWMTAPLRKEFSEDYQQFCDAAQELGMVYERSRVQGEYTWSYQLLPKMPIKVIYYDADDEFPCDIKILYDKTALQFLEFEPLAVLNGCFITTLAGIGKKVHNASLKSCKDT